VFVESHPRRSPNSFLTLTPIPGPPSPNSDISPAALFPRSAIRLSLLESALADKHRVLPVFSRNRPHLSPLECALVSLLISVDSKALTVTLTPLDATLTKNTGGRGPLPSTRSLLRYFSPKPEPHLPSDGSLYFLLWPVRDSQAAQQRFEEPRDETC
jgi:hypothetical protein